jgi:hypothetical protein
MVNRKFLRVTVPTLLIAALAASLITVISRTSEAAKANGQKNNQKKALIEVGWDAPTPDYVRDHIQEMEKQPFAGTMINLRAGKTIFNKTAYPDSAFVDDRESLRKTKSKVMTENFITIWSAREASWDWFSDEDWEATQRNAKNFAMTAKASKVVKGFIFDPEPYGTDPWTYTKELYPTKSLPEVRAQVRKRGAAFLSTIQREMPNVKIITLFGLLFIQEQLNEGKAIEELTWMLYPDFINGMLDVIGPNVELIEGNESSYYYTNSGPSDFDYGVATKKSGQRTGGSRKPHEVRQAGFHVECGLHRWFIEPP